MKNKLLLILFLSIVLIFGITLTSNAADLDRIEDYEIKVDVRNDGTLDMLYHIEWRVLDSTSEGPLEWVKIGIPNEKIDSIKPLSDTISSIKLYKSGGTYIRVDFDRAYMANEVIKFDFSFHQSYMYTLDNNKCTYSFTPGWFDDIEVKNLTIKWNSEKQLSNNSNSTKDGNYLVWNYSLRKGKKVTAKVEYNRNAFNVDENKQYRNANGNESSIIVVVIVMIVIICIISIITAPFRRVSYYSRRGFGPHYTHHIHHGPPPRHHGGCACASSCASSCACACACAGGGRAGCSKKDFYGTNIKTKNIK